jgi:hypothetical protein
MQMNKPVSLRAASGLMLRFAGCKEKLRLRGIKENGLGVFEVVAVLAVNSCMAYLYDTSVYDVCVCKPYGRRWCH